MDSDSCVTTGDICPSTWGTGTAMEHHVEGFLGTQGALHRLQAQQRTHPIALAPCLQFYMCGTWMAVESIPGLKWDIVT